MLSSLSAIQRGGVYIFFGGVISAIGRALKPGVFVDSVDWNNIDGLVRAMDDNAVLTHTSAVLYAFGLMFLLTGLNSIRHYVTEQGLAGDMIRGGTLLGMLCLLVMAVIEGFDHMAVRVLDDGIGRNGLASMDIAVSMQSAKLAMLLITWPIFYASIGIAGLGGLRLLPAGAHRTIQGVASLVMLLISVLLLMSAALEANGFWMAIQWIIAVVLAIWSLALSHASFIGKVSESSS